MEVAVKRMLFQVGCSEAVRQRLEGPAGAQGIQSGVRGPGSGVRGPGSGVWGPASEVW